MIRNIILSAAGNLAVPQGWNLSTISYDSVFYAPNQSNNFTYGIYLSRNGLNLYRASNFSTDARIRQYALSSPNSLSSVSYTNVSPSLGSTAARNVFLKPDGTKAYVVLFNVGLRQYSLSTPFDITTMTYDSKQISGNLFSGIFFSDDGLKLYLTDLGTSGRVKEYTLSTAWDISTASLVRNVTTGIVNVWGVSFKRDGTKMYVSGGGTSGTFNTSPYRILEYTLSTPWDTSTISLTYTHNIAESREAITGHCWNAYGTKVYICAFFLSSADRIYQYSVTS